MVIKRLHFLLIISFVLFQNIQAKKPSNTFYQIDSIVNDAIAKRVFPGCQVLVLKDGAAIYEKCFGNYRYRKPPVLCLPL